MVRPLNFKLPGPDGIQPLICVTWVKLLISLPHFSMSTEGYVGSPLRDAVDPGMETVLFIHLKSTHQPHIHVRWSYMSISRLGKRLLFLLCPKAVSGNQATSKKEDN